MTAEWRKQANSKLAKAWKSPWTGDLVPAGTEVTLVSVIKLNKKKNIVVPVPNATAIFLNASARSYNEAKKLRKNSNIDSSIKKQVQFESDSASFDYIERMIESVIMAFTALEAFANEMIPDDFEYHVHKKSKTILEIYNKAKIERNISLDEKLSTILPEVFGIESPKGSNKAWENFKSLKKIRDRIIYMKHSDTSNTWLSLCPLK